MLLVEDEPTLSKLVGKLLDQEGYEHVSIADHKQIAEAIVRWRPQCIILDSDPGSTGHERSWADAAAIRRAHPDLPVLMFTADPASMAEARAGTTARSKAAGYAGVIDKPFLVVEFLATLKHAVDAPQTSSARDGKGISAEAITVFPELSGPASVNWSAADFLSMAVHELRTPLTSIDGQTQLAQRFILKDPVRAADALARVREQSKRMNRLIGDLLDHARVSVGALSLEVATFDLGVAIAITIGLHEHEDTARITFPTPRPIRVQGDPERIAQVLGNLLDNALKYSAPGSPINVSLTVVGTEAQIRVTDRGIGVPDDERDRIFAPFYRTSRTRDISGTGLGLHISQRITDQHHGRLWLDSSSGAGSVFVLALPLAGSATAIGATGPTGPRR
ncbi:MAG TPA: ATP-binding protein [Candidatus Limnocylindria bacterium]|nr:ATP-binding protein [Candidatus Limnocylindria bacterium]